jgi:hypothetical protein
MTDQRGSGYAALTPQHRVERGAADLGQAGDLGFRHAGLERLRGQHSDCLGFGQEPLARRGARAAMCGKRFADLVHEPSVKHLTSIWQGRKVIYMAKTSRTTLDGLEETSLHRLAASRRMDREPSVR